MSDTTWPHHFRHGKCLKTGSEPCLAHHAAYTQQHAGANHFNTMQKTPTSLLLSQPPKMHLVGTAFHARTKYILAAKKYCRTPRSVRAEQEQHKIGLELAKRLHQASVTWHG